MRWRWARSFSNGSESNLTTKGEILSLLPRSKTNLTADRRALFRGFYMKSMVLDKIFTQLSCFKPKVAENKTKNKF